MVRASIIIPALNEADNLARNLAVVRSQMGPTDELIVVDNGSSDETVAVAKKHGGEIVHEPVRGRSNARNAGIARSRGELFVFLDADCRPATAWLTNLLIPFEDSTVGSVAGEISVIHGDNSLGRYLLSKGHLAQRVNFQHPFLPFGGAANIAFRRSVLAQIGGFDEGLFSGHDADLCWRMQLETDLKIVLAEDAVVEHYLELTPRTLIRQKRRHGHGAVLLYRKYRSRRQRECRPFKLVYWEYRSIAKRAVRYMIDRFTGRFGMDGRTDPEQSYQIFLEIGEKLGRVEGSVRHRVWFP